MKSDVKAIAATVGGVVALSKRLGLSRGAVSQWDRVPAIRVLEVEAITGIGREELRPDIFGAPPIPLVRNEVRPLPNEERTSGAVVSGAPASGAPHEGAENG